MSALITRRRALLFLATPFVVKAASLMPVSSRNLPFHIRSLAVRQVDADGDRTLLTFDDLTLDGPGASALRRYLWNNAPDAAGVYHAPLPEFGGATDMRIGTMYCSRDEPQDIVSVRNVSFKKTACMISFGVSTTAGGLHHELDVDRSEFNSWWRANDA